MAKGRKPKFDADQIIKLKEMYARGATGMDLAKQFGVSLPTIYKYLKMEVVPAPALNPDGTICQVE